MTKVICLDPGHARNTPGKRAGTNPTFYEYLSNRNIAQKARALLEASGFRVFYSVNLSDPVDKSLAARGQTARSGNADLFISIHTNAADPAVRGTETFIHTNSQASLRPAEIFQAAQLNELNTRNRGVKRANFGVLRATYQHMLSVLLEAEFFTNPTARNWMLQADFENRYAVAIAKGTCQLYGVSYKGANPSATLPPPPAATEDVGARLLRVKPESLWVYHSAAWQDRAFTVQKDEVFTIERGPIAVGNGRMYQLKSGLFITASDLYVELVGRVAVAQPIPQPEHNKVPIRPYPGYLIRLQNPYMRDRSGVSDIAAVQRAVGVNADGVYGPVSERSVRAYQQRQALTVDGIVGPATWNRLF